MKKILLTFILAAIATHASASVTTVNASGDGWCDSGSCNNSNTTAFDNNDLSSGINNWQSFSLGTPGTITGATLSIYESSAYGSFYNYGSGNINFYIASGINFNGLENGPSIGEIVSGSSEPVGNYVTIVLNSYGIQELNLLQGTSFVIGGSNGGSDVDAFGYSSSSSPAPYLTVTTVPEPATMALLGLGLLGFAISRRKSAK